MTKIIDGSQIQERLPDVDHEVVLVYPGIWRVRVGEPEIVTPHAIRWAEPADPCSLPLARDFPVKLERWRAESSRRGLYLEIPWQGEGCFGLGLQLSSTIHRGRKRKLRVNSDPPTDTGDSHAPVPLLVSSVGYGLLFDTARTIDLGIASYKPPDHTKPTDSAIATDTQALYDVDQTAATQLLAEVPIAQGVDIYVIAGPTSRDVVRRYNLFSGGGFLPSLKSLGIWYRGCAKFDDQQSLALARHLRDQDMPCDVFGLEPGWQSSAYPCSFEWDATRFADSDRFITDIADLGMELNLWEHAYLAAGTPLREIVGNRVGRWAVFDGAVPDLFDPDVRRAVTDYHRDQFVAKGIAGFKLDECDGSDFKKRAWSFPDYDRFPSGIDGEQMHGLFGVLYQQAVQQAFQDKGKRTFSQVRSSGAFAAPLSFVLYSDLYDHRDYIRGLCSAGWSGLLWCPEVRKARSGEDLIRRMQSAVLSPHALINAWQYIRPPWDETYDDLPPGQVQSRCRELLTLRMRLVPYLYAAFAEYDQTGLPPVRPLAMDWPDDPETYGIEDAYLIGSDLLVVALFAGERTKRFYLPDGDWHHVFTGEILNGGCWHQREVDLDDTMLFARGGSLLPVARPMTSIQSDTVFEIDVFAYGNIDCASARLLEDDGISLDGDFNKITLTIGRNDRLVIDRCGTFTPYRYQFASNVLHNVTLNF